MAAVLVVDRVGLRPWIIRVISGAKLIVLTLLFFESSAGFSDSSENGPNDRLLAKMNSQFFSMFRVLRGCRPQCVETAIM